MHDENKRLHSNFVLPSIKQKLLNEERVVKCTCKTSSLKEKIEQGDCFILPNWTPRKKKLSKALDMNRK
jgi:hypothetical protein